MPKTTKVGVGGWVFRNLLWGPAAATIAFVPLVCINLFQMASVVVAAVSRPAFRRINTGFAGGIWTFWSILLEEINGTKVTLTGDQLPDGEDAIVFCNHQSMSDIMVIVCIARRAKTVGSMKWLVKDVVKYVPGVGWGMLFLDCVFLKRNWADDEKNIKATFSRIVDNKLPVWLVSFPEGTRITPEKKAQAQAFAEKRGMPVPQAVMLPRPKGFAASVIGLREHVKAVYSITIKYEGGARGIWPLLNGEVRQVYADVKRFPIAELPREEAGLSAWIMHEFYRKDRIMAALGKG